MKVNEITDGMRAVETTGMITDIKPRESVSLRTGGTADVATAILSDETGDIKLSLWDKMIDVVSKGTKVKIVNGYTTLFKGEKQLNVGRYGTLTVVEP